MNCSKCGSTNVQVQMLNEIKIKRQHRSILMWILVWWWVELLLWIFLTIPRLLLSMFLPKRKKIITTSYKTAICQNCGNDWKI